MEGVRTNIWSSNTSYITPDAMSSWGLAGPITDFDSCTADIAENPTDGGAAYTNNYTAPIFHPLWLTQTHPLSDLASAVLPGHDDPRAQAVSTPSLTQTMAASHSVPIPGLAPTATSHNEKACLVEPDKQINPLLVCSTVDDNVAAGWIVPKPDADIFNVPGSVIPSSLEGSAPSGHYVYALGLAPPASAPGIFELPRMDFCERNRGTDHDLDDEGRGPDNDHGVRLRGKGRVPVTTMTGISDTGGSTHRIHRKPVVKAPASVKTTSKAVGYRVDKLTTPTVQGGCDQLSQVPSFRYEPTATTTQEGLPSVKRSLQGATWGQNDNMLQQEEVGVDQMENDKSTATTKDLFYVPKRLKEEYKLFLRATSEDFERGTLHVLKCKLCPRASFRTWDHFTRHCKTAERHPLEIFFCDHCGDFFARGESLERHSNNRASECRHVDPREVEAKRKETIMIHKEFLKNMKVCLKTDQGIWTPFAQVVKERYPNSSKKLKGGRRQEGRLQAPESRLS